MNKSCSIVIQGEGKGHFSQALAFCKELEEEGVEVKKVFLGRSIGMKQPAYFEKVFPYKIGSFYSPNFLQNSSKKGIKVGWSLFLNFFLIPLFLFESIRLGVALKMGGGKWLFNFYDPVGAVAGKFFKRKRHVVSISHHFYFMHPDFSHPYGFDRQYFWMFFMSSFMRRNSGKVMALSFRKGKDVKNIRVVPPLLELGTWKLDHSGASFEERDLCYFLKSGFVEEALTFYRAHPERQVDIFSSVALKDVPDNVRMQEPDRNAFLECLKHTGRFISTSGFDSVAEAFYFGVPVFLIPTEHHYEQYCNALDAARTGMAYQLDSLADLEEVEFEAKSNKVYTKWVDSFDVRTFFPEP